MEVDCKSTGSAYVGSNPTLPICLISSAVEHLVYTEAVGGSIPSSSISILLLMKHEKLHAEIKELSDEIIYIKGLLHTMSHQIQDLHEQSYQSKRSLPKVYEHPWYKYKKELIHSSL